MLEALDRSRRGSAPAGRRRVARAAHPAHEPAHERRGAGAERPAAAPTSASASSPTWSTRSRSSTLLVSDVVELARGNEPAAEIGDVRLDLLVDDAVERARRHSPHVRFETELEPTVVRGEPARISRAVGNLLDNAAKWSPPDGVVDVALRNGVVTVRDHGPGIDEADLPARLRPLLPCAGVARPPRLGPRPRDRAPGRRGARRTGHGPARERRRRPAPPRAPTSFLTPGRDRSGSSRAGASGSASARGGRGLRRTAHGVGEAGSRTTTGPRSSRSSGVISIALDSFTWRPLALSNSSHLSRRSLPLKPVILTRNSRRAPRRASWAFV